MEIDFKVCRIFSTFKSWFILQLDKDPKEVLDDYFSSLDDIRAPNTAIATMQLSVDRLIESIETPEVANVVKDVIKMLSLLDEKNITSDIIISCTEVALVVANGKVRMIYFLFSLSVIMHLWVEL